MLETTSKIKKSQQWLTSVLDGETVMMSIDNGNYYAISPVGTSIWSMLEKERTVEEICEGLMEEYSVSREQCISETLKFLNELLKEEIIQVTN